MSMSEAYTSSGNQRTATENEDGANETSPLLHPPSHDPSQLPPAPSPPPPPDGGLHAWTQVLTAHLLNLNIFGYTNSFSIFQEHYTNPLSTPLTPTPSPSATSWIGSVRVLLIFLLAPLTGPLTDAGHFRTMLLAGISLQLTAVTLTSFATRYWHVLLAQGLLQGLGDGLIYCPALAVVSTYFSARRRTVALACVACGGATGGLVFPALARALLFRVGFAWTVRAMGLVMAVNAGVAVVFAEARLPPREVRGLVRLAGFREVGYSLFTAGVFLCFLGLFFGYYYISPFAVSKLHAPPTTSFNTVLILNFSGILGRLIPAYISDAYIGPLQTLIPSAFMSSILFFLWPLVTTLPQLYILVAFLGFSLASIQSTFPAAAASFAKGRVEDVGVRMGMVFGVVAWACVSGPPVAGWLIEWMDGSYIAAQAFGGVCLVMAFLVASRVTEVGWTSRKRV